MNEPDNGGVEHELAQKIAEKKSAEAVEANTAAQQAAEEARLAQVDLIRTTVVKAMQDTFSVEGLKGRYVDISRVPLICQSIIEMSTNIKEMRDDLKNNYVRKESFSPVQKVVYGMVGLILTGVLLWILSIAFNAHLTLGT